MRASRIIALVLGAATGLGAGWLWSVSRPASLVVQVQATPYVTPNPACNILKKISQAQRALESVTLEMHGSDTQIALELLNPQTCILRRVIITKHDDELIAPSGYDIEAVKRANGIRWNYWATQYVVHKPAGWIVAANAYPTDEALVVYTPYTDALNTPKIVQAGKQYLTELAGRAQQELRTLQVPSRTTPGTLIADMPELKPEFIARLAPIEHMDLEEFLLDPAWSTDRIYVLLAVNRDRTGSYTCNKANACGLMQFTPGTYELMEEAYPSAKLISDFVNGARDPLNAMKAAFVLHDYNLAQFKRKMTAQQFSALCADEALLEESLSSAYNTGESRTIAVLKAYFANPKRVTDWVYAKGTLAKTWLVDETKGYIAKLRYVREQ